jgi:predicted DNA-binding transcriptional regulator
MIESVITSSSDSQIIHFFIVNKSKSWRISELSRELGLSRTTVTNAVKRFLDYQLLIAEGKKYRIDLSKELGINLANFELALNYYNRDKVEKRIIGKTGKKKG